MDIVIAGGHGQIALRLARLLAARGDTVRGIIRNPGHAADVRDAGAEPVVCDLEAAGTATVAGHLAGADAVVFAAGAGPGSGAARKDTVDRAASVLTADAAERAGVRDFVQISAMGAGEKAAPGRGEVWDAYIRAKGEAEDDLRDRDAIDWLILRPGGLTDDPGTGLVRLEEPPIGHGAVTRDDVAAVIVALLDAPGVRRRTLDLLNGGTPVEDAVASLR
ncbi:NAD(P)H-binding protein [Actinomadura bangladeshensis]|uniref:NAD-dependent epimerase/dehydratase family protein n=1 Tax=Actinomadura bangladeshensis TaxID=453573 RepID=A0A4R4NY32_9ACTN|nr:NAD(P)H-binding protein [Actinomadura bangladeshensis]TDC14044.1 NAD-dependent epimerase/dehydratase family protein [Actinomadura bangladeshensis]